MMRSSYAYLFRVNGSYDLGLGHIFRTQALAQQLKARKKNSLFLINSDKRSEKILKDFDCIKLNNENINEEIFLIEKTLKKYSIKILINDLFVYEDSYQEFSSKCNVKVVTFHEHEISDCFSDLLINYNTFNGSINSEDLDPTKCLGPNYCIFPNTLRTLEKIDVNKNVKKILLSFGGSDPSKLTTKLITYILNNEEHFDDIEEIIIHLGPSNNQLKEIKNLIKLSTLIIKIKYNVDNLHEIMSGCDLAFASGGNTMYELCALGVPTLIFPQNQHQENFSSELGKRNIIKLIKRDMIESESFIINQIFDLIKNIDQRNSMSNLSTALFDINGIERVCGKIISLEC